MPATASALVLGARECGFPGSQLSQGMIAAMCILFVLP